MCVCVANGLWFSFASLQYAQHASSNVISLAEHLGTRISDHVPETPNKLSEDMIKCMSALYCKLADPPLTHNGLSSPNSSLSSTGAFSPRDQCDMWSPGFRNNSSFDVRLDNPFHVEGLKEFSGPYSTMVEVPWIYRDGQKLGDTEPLLQNFRWSLMICLPKKISSINDVEFNLEGWKKYIPFEFYALLQFSLLLRLFCYRSLISQLEEVDPRKLKHEEKLAFWINIHNALVMHVMILISRYVKFTVLTHFHSFISDASEIYSICCLGIGIFGLWDSTKQCKESFSTLKGRMRIIGPVGE